MPPVQSLKRTSAEARRDSGAGMMTPSKTPSSPDKSTMRLKLEIPRRDISKEEERKLKIRKAAAKRWVPNLQRPPPQLKEINAAYNNKLMRHYTDGTAAPSDNIIRPPINRSARVDALLATLPLQPAQKLPKPLSQEQAEHREQVRVAALLEPNRKITESAYAKELAKEAFSSNGKPRDRKSLKRKRKAKTSGFAESTGQDGV
ncbi:hypothetical protein J4E89_003639 [Alternaria sp. Ai002NY15]|nr:hypothetical protein J4E89_003639 [Alternaria sp. Ai002NY15]